MKKAMRKDRFNNPMQAFVSDPVKAQEPQTLAGTLSLATLLDFKEVVAVVIYSDADITRYFNSDTTKTRTIPALTEVTIIIDNDVTDITLSGTATVEIEAM